MEVANNGMEKRTFLKNVCFESTLTRHYHEFYINFRGCRDTESIRMNSFSKRHTLTNHLFVSKRKKKEINWKNFDLEEISQQFIRINCAMKIKFKLSCNKSSKKRN